MERHFRQYTDSLPDETLRDIGQLMASTSLIDQLLRAALGVRLGLDMKATRDKLGSIQWHSALHRLRKNLDEANIVIEGADLRALEKELERLYELRDLVGHCVWVNGPDGRPLLVRTRDGRPDGRMRWEIPEGVDIADGLRLGVRDARYAADEAQRIYQWIEDLDGRWAKASETEGDRGSFGMTATATALEAHIFPGKKQD